MKVLEGEETGWSLAINHPDTIFVTAVYWDSIAFEVKAKRLAIDKDLFNQDRNVGNGILRQLADMLEEAVKREKEAQGDE